MSHQVGKPNHEPGLAEHLHEVLASEQASFHMPGHKGGRGAPPLGLSLLGNAAYALDLSELSGFDYLHGANSALEKAQQRAAKIFGAKRSWYLINGATVGNIGAISAVVGDGETIIVARSSHRSVYAGIAISGARPVYVAPVRNDHLDGLFGVDPADIERSLDNHPKARAVHVSNPSYYGFTVPLQQITDLVHERDIPLIVDEAHGTHFVFNDAFPTAALACGADLVVQSPHKTLGSLTQSSILHFQGQRVDASRVQSILSMLQSSSPSALLLLSLDVAINEMASHGASRWQQAIDLAQDVRKRVTALEHIAIYSDEINATDGIYGYDPIKVVIDVDELGTTGFAAGRWLRDEWRINPEFSDLRRMVFSVTIGDGEQQADLLVDALTALAANGHALYEHSNVVSLWPRHLPSMHLTPREAQQRQHRIVDASAAIGNTSVEMIVPYPPGVPLIVPGEEITSEALQSMQQLIGTGCHVVGLSDPTGQTLRVID